MRWNSRVRRKASLSAQARMTLCNMTVEAGARAALIAPDQTTFDYVRVHATSLDEAAWNAALADRLDHRRPFAGESP